MIRAYVPAVVADVKAWHPGARLPAGAPVVLITAALRADNPEADEEELEYLASSQALRVAVEMAAARDDRPAVVAVDVDEVAHTTLEPVPTSRWAAVFVDDLQWFAVEEIPFL